MRLRFNILLALLLGFAGLQAQEVPTDRYRGLLWKISGEGLEQPSYLYGTIHAIPKTDFFVVEGLEEELANSSVLLMELSLDFEMADMVKIAPMLMMPNRASVETLLTEEEYLELQTFMKDSMPYQLPFYQYFKPIFTTQFITSAFCEGTDQVTYELFLKQIADSLEIPVEGLETMEEQMDVLNSIPLEDQAEGLMETIRNPRSTCDQFTGLVDLYKLQDLDGLQRLTEAETEADSLGMEELLDKRNQKWIPLLESYMTEGQVFVAVGAGHLPGPNGVIELLRKRGYEVTALYKEE